jgi:TP901 family phage tail tape measure protein
MYPSYAQILRQLAQDRPHAPALTFEGETWTFAQLHQRSSQTANALKAAGVGVGDRVALLTKNCAECFELMLACNKIGAILTGLNWRLAPAEIQAGALESTMNLAATEGMHLSDAAVIIAQTMNTFKMSAEDTTKAVDFLAAGAVASTAGVQDLADGMKYVGSTASTLGVGMGETVTALAAMNNAGIDSTTAGTSLNRMLLGLKSVWKQQLN